MLDHVNPEHHLRSMIGYHLAWENSLIGMVMVQGKQREVVNIGLGIKQVAVEPRDVTVPQYVESLSHKVCGTRFICLCPFLFVPPPRGCGSIPHPPGTANVAIQIHS
jgi:4'-phosphopantetheinyl transferase